MTDAGLDAFHSPTDADPYWTETFWVSFWVPERTLSGTVYTWFRPNLGVCASCVAVWDGTATDPWDVPFYEYDWHLPIPEGAELTDLTLANGLGLRCEEPEQRYTVRFDRAGQCALDLRFDGIAPPHEAPMARLRFAGAAHYDQFGHVTGRLDLHGTTMEIDCYAIRDRSWGPRPDRGGLRAGYSAGAASPEHAFHTISATIDGTDTVVAGSWLRDGKLVAIRSGTRQVVARTDRMPQRVVIDATDGDGRELHAEGECVNRLAFPARPGCLTWMSLTRWSFAGEEAWGEDQDIWSPDTWRVAHPR